MNDKRVKDKKKGKAGFAHHSEREFARILDFYQIEWRYEPRTFDLHWDDKGNPIESFSPDFYLPELDLFIELTTLRQSLVTKKNRKLRRLRELYPDINIKLFYNRDFKSLMAKYGLSLASAPEKQVAVDGDGQTNGGEVGEMAEDRLSPE